MQLTIQQRAVSSHAAVVFDESRLAEFVHEEIGARLRRAHHRRQCFRGLERAAVPALISLLTCLFGVCHKRGRQTLCQAGLHTSASLHQVIRQPTRQRA